VVRHKECKKPFKGLKPETEFPKGIRSMLKNYTFGDVISEIVLEERKLVNFCMNLLQ